MLYGELSAEQRLHALKAIVTDENALCISEVCLAQYISIHACASAMHQYSYVLYLVTVCIDQVFLLNEIISPFEFTEGI